MTSDAKIGLLLGLAFIFIIAFIINGLPSFRNKTDSNELTTNMTTFEDDPLGIETKERKTQEAINWREVVEKKPFKDAQAASDRQDIRSITPLPGSLSTAEEPDKRAEIEPQIASDIPSPAGAQGPVVKAPQPAKPTWPKIYVVSENDNLASIAKKFYGPEEGNKRINVNRIFEANRKQLRSPDEIYVGQKLIVPPPSNPTPGKNKIDSALPSTLFEKVESIGRSILSDSVDSRGTKQSKWYVVRQGDSLWKIAAEQLGNGSRFSEISELNSGILSDEDNLTIGMRLRMPAR
jgi:nucleoid-associated protein YgaU